MDPIGVGTQGRSGYVKGFYTHILAAIESEVELGAIFDSKSLHSQIRAHEEPYGLHNEIYMKFNQGNRKT